MRRKTVSATEAKNHFGGVLREVNQTDEPIVVEKDGKPVAVILSMEAYERLLPKERPLTLKESQAPYAFGLWANRDDIDEEWLANGRSRAEATNMQTYTYEFTMKKKGELTLKNLPFEAGEEIEVIIIPRAKDQLNEKRYPFWGKPITYINPTEPVAETDWDILQ